MKHFSIAIDGPAGAGKSTIAKMVAERLGFVYVDTGAMYRAMALGFLRKGIAPEDEASVSQACKSMDVAIVYRDGTQQVLLDGENVSDLIRTGEVGKMASIISGYLPVRRKLVELQKELAAGTSVVMDGRDIGTCVLPGAPAKIFLTASAAVRAARRCRELEKKGVECRPGEVEREIKARDERDMNREHSPLKQAQDAVLLDSSHMDETEVAEAVIRIAAEHGLEVPS